MKLIEVGNKIFEVKPCLHCKKDEIEYSPEDLPWNTDGWYCDNCTSTYVIFNKEIAEDVTLREERNDKIDLIYKKNN